MVGWWRFGSRVRFLDDRLLCGLGRWRGGGGSCCSFTSPDQYSTVFICSQTLSFNKFKFQVFERLIIQLKLAFEGTVGQSSSPLEHRNGLIEEVVKGHGEPSDNSSNRALASLRSAVSNPSVNQW